MTELAKSIFDLALARRIEPTACFEKWLDFMIESNDHKWMPGGLREQLAAQRDKDPEFFMLMLGFYLGVQKAMDQGTWDDQLGKMYEDLFLTKAKAGSHGQFFTPKTVADLMAQCTLREEIQPDFCTVNEPTCGSGRNVLAFEMLRDRSKRAFYVCEDLDPLCCKMCVCNIMAYGMHGVVICRDTLRMDWRDAWYVNECQYPIRHSELYNSTRHLASQEETDALIARFVRR